MKITKSWVSKQMKKNPTEPKWQLALDKWNELDSVSKRSPYYYDYAERACRAITAAMFTISDQIDARALFEQSARDMDNNMADRVNYTLEFRYDVARAYLHIGGWMSGRDDEFIEK